MPSVKARGLKALRAAKLNSNLWVLFAKWKESGRMPDEFKVLIIGPPRSFKTQIAGWLKQLWPQVECVKRRLPREHIDQRDPLPFRLADVAGFPIIIRTFNYERQVGEHVVRYEYATVPKQRWTGTDPVKEYEIVPRRRV